MSSTPAPLSLTIHPRRPGQTPLGAILALPILLLPVGGWLVESGTMTLARCSFKTLVGVPCMGCGGTRATVNLLHGDFFEAFYFSPMIAIGWFALLLWGLVSLWLYIGDKELDLRMTRGLTWTVRGVLIAIPFANWFYLIANDL